MRRRKAYIRYTPKFPPMCDVSECMNTREYWDSPSDMWMCSYHDACMGCRLVLQRLVCKFSLLMRVKRDIVGRIMRRNSNLKRIKCSCSVVGMQSCIQYEFVVFYLARVSHNTEQGENNETISCWYVWT